MTSSNEIFYEYFMNGLNYIVNRVSYHIFDHRLNNALVYVKSWYETLVT